MNSGEAKLIPEVVYETAKFAALSKPAGLLVHETAISKKNLERAETLADWVAEHYPETKSVGDDPASRPGIVHRLDKDTSGIMLIARDQGYFEYLKNLFQTHQVRKTYLALVRGRVKEKEGRIEKPIGLKPNTVKRVVGGRKMKDVKEAITEYRTAGHFEADGKEYTLLEVSPLTGRTHQIRVHLASIGHPVAGDRLYGGGGDLGLNRQFLHAESIEFPESPGRRIKLSADLPDELQKTLGKLTKIGSFR